MVLVVIFGLILGIYFITSINETVMGFVNPEYGAIKHIVEMAKEIKN